MKNVELYRDEVWEDIPNFEHKYQASTMGRIRSKDTYGAVKNGYVAMHKGRIIKPRLQNGGYLIVWLRKDGKTYAKTVHRLMAETFIENPNGLSDINHKDSVRINNGVINLEWCDRSYNVKYAYLHGHKQKNSKKVICVETGRIYDSIKEAEQAHSLKGGIGQMLNGRNKSAGGFTWKKL